MTRTPDYQEQLSSLKKVEKQPEQANEEQALLSPEVIRFQDPNTKTVTNTTDESPNKSNSIQKFKDDDNADLQLKIVKIDPVTPEKDVNKTPRHESGRKFEEEQTHAEQFKTAQINSKKSNGSMKTKSEKGTNKQGKIISLHDKDSENSNKGLSKQHSIRIGSATSRYLSQKGQVQEVILETEESRDSQGSPKKSPTPAKK